MIIAGEDLVRLAALADDSPAMLWRGNEHGRCVYLNAAMRSFWGLTVEECGQFDWSTSLLEDDREKVFGPFAEGMNRRQAFVCEGRYRRHDGEVRILRTRAFPCFDDAGAFDGMIGVNEDLTDLRRAEQELEAKNAALAQALAHHQRLNDRLRLATNISGLAMSEHDSDLRYTWAHNLPPEVMGKTPSEIVGGGDVGSSLHAILRRALDEGEPQSEELLLSVNGNSRWFDIQTARIVRPDGSLGVVASALDVTERKLNQQKLEVLARELGHRVKNVFAVVQAIIRQSARAQAAPPGFVAGVEARLQALAQAQDDLLGSQDNQVMISDFLRRQLMHVSGVALDGPDLPVPGAVAPYVALAIHELSTNALKYGALRTPEGEVRLTWQAVEPHRLEMVWSERGCAPCDHSKAPGFGTTLLTKIFSAATGGTVALVPTADGLSWTANFSIRPSLAMGDAPHG